MYCNNCVFPKNLHTPSTEKRLELNCDFQRHGNERLTPSHRQHWGLVGIVNVDVFLQGSQMAFWLQLLTALLRKWWTPEIFQECCLCSHQSQQSSAHANKPQNYKLITVAVCSLVFSHLLGFFFVTQYNYINICGVHGFLSFTVRGQLSVDPKYIAIPY